MGALQRATAGIALATALLGGCAGSPPATPAAPSAPAGRELLNSERIERRFGSYGIEVLESDDRVRVSNLFSLEGEQRICRTLAVVLFPTELDPRLASEHRLIQGGGSIGAVFRARGWTVGKRHRLLTELGAPAADDRLASLMNLAASDGPLAVDIYDLSVGRPGVPALHYATIAEVHHPDYLRLADLRRLHGGAVPASSAGDAELLDLVQRVLSATRGRSPGAADSVRR